MTCGLCQKLEATPTGGWVHRDGTWAVAVQDGYEAPGWIVLQTCRHVESTSALDDREVAGLGSMLRRLTAAIEAVVPDTERVYLVVFGETFPHWHVLLLPRITDIDRRGGRGDRASRQADRHRRGRRDCSVARRAVGVNVVLVGMP